MLRDVRLRNWAGVSLLDFSWFGGKTILFYIDYYRLVSTKTPINTEKNVNKSVFIY